MRPPQPQLGGSACLKARQNTKVSSKDELKLRSRAKAALKLKGNDEFLVKLTNLYDSLGKGNRPTQCDFENQGGMIISFIGHGLSEQKIRSFIPLGLHDGTPSKETGRLVLVVLQTQTYRTCASSDRHWKQQTFLKMVSLARSAA